MSKSNLGATPLGEFELGPGKTEFSVDISFVVASIPCGEVRYYSEVATQAGHPRSARATAQAIEGELTANAELAELGWAPPFPCWPWWRVIRKSHKILDTDSRREDHRRRLEREGWTITKERNHYRIQPK